MEQILHQILSTASTVILPHFGAIIKLGESYQFNEFLKYNDGKLIKAVEEAQNSSTEEATIVVSDYIRKIKEHLNANKDFDLGIIGSFSKKGEKVIISKPKSGSTTSNEPNVPKLVVKKEATPKKEKTVAEAKPDKAVAKEELPKAYTSTNLVVDKAIEKIASFKTKKELTAFAKGETREQVLTAINTKKEGLSKTKVVPTPIVEKSNKKEPKVEIKKEADKKIVSLKPTKEKQKVEVKKEEIKEITPVIEKEEPKTTPKVENKKEVATPIAKTELKKDSPKTATKEPKTLPVITPKEVTLKVEQKTVVKTPVADAKPDLKKEASKTATKEIKTSIPKYTSKEEVSKIEKGLMEGAIVIEKEAKKRKRNRLILWAAILLLLIGTSIIGFLKKNELIAMINKTEIAENKDLVNPKKETKDEHSKDSDTKHADVSVVVEQKDLVNDHVSEEEANVVAHEEIIAAEKQEVESTEKIIEEVIVEEEIIEEVEAIVEKNKPESKGKYNIVVGSFSEKGNATKLVEKLNKEGYSNAKVLGKFGGLYAVSINNFESRSVAKSKLSEIKGKGFSGWIKKV